MSSQGSLEHGEAGTEAIVEKLPYPLCTVTLHKHLTRIWGAHVFPSVGYTHNDMAHSITLAVTNFIASVGGAGRWLMKEAGECETPEAPGTEAGETAQLCGWEPLLSVS